MEKICENRSEILSRFLKIMILGITGCVIFVSCKEEPKPVPLGGVAYQLYARTANYLWADNIKGEVKMLPSLKGGLVPMIVYNASKKTDSIRVNEYVLGFTTCNLSLEEIYRNDSYYKEVFESDMYDALWQAPYMWLNFDPNNQYAEEDDVTIKNNLLKYLNDYSESLKNLTKGDITRVDYRLNPMTSFNITCSKRIGGIEAGKSVNSLFKIHGYPSWQHFVITTSKKVVFKDIFDISLDKYMSFKPLAPVGLYLMFNDEAEVEETADVTFTIELGLERGRKIYSTTAPITLTGRSAKSGV